MIFSKLLGYGLWCHSLYRRYGYPSCHMGHGEIARFQSSNPYQYGLYSNLIGMGGGRHVFFNFDFLITFETFYNKNLVAEWLGQLPFDLKDPGSNPVFGKFFFSVFLQMRFFQVSDKLQK